MGQPPRYSKQLRPYAGAVLVTLTATVLRLLLQPLIGFDFPFITYFAAAFVSAWWFGFKPTLLTVLLSAFLTDLLFFAPTGAGGRTGYLLGFIGLALFVGIGVGAAYMGKGRLDAQRRAETAAAEAQRLQAVAEEEAARAEEEATRADEESARAQGGHRFFVLSRDLLCTLGFDGYFKDLNPAWQTTLGYTKAELLATPLIEFIHPDDRLATATEAEKLTTGSELNAFENRYRCKDGSYRSFLWSATAVAADRLIYGAARDITDRKLAEAALLKAGALEGAILNSPNFSCIATDAKGVIQIFNVGAERMLGYAAEEVVNKITPAALHDSQEVIARAAGLSLEYATPIAPGFEALVFKAARRIKDVYELTKVRKDGSRFPAVVSVSALRDAQDAIIGYLLIGTDNTAQKQVEEQRKKFEDTLQQKNLELEDASRMKSEFLANMSHELRTPLNSIIGFSEVLRDGLMGEMTEKQRGFVGDIFSSGNHLLSLINDILDLSKVEAGKMTLDLEPVVVSSLLANSLSIVREKAAAHRIRLDLQAAEGMGLIHADARKVKQIVYNLLSNAVKFTAKGGQVTLRAGSVPRADVGRLSGSWTGRSLPLALNEFEDFLKISVTDSGIGISNDGLERLFQPFSQIDSGLARKFEGTGLGLVMVRLLAELHGGAVAVESAVGQGSCFTVWLPLRAAEKAALTGAKPPGARRIEAQGGTRTALVVEDDYKSAALIRVHLEAEGFKVLHAASAEAALVLAVQQPVSLITLDILLPNMEGWEFLTRIKQVTALRRIPVVIISIVADPNTGFSLGAAAVMQKPISRHELYEALVDLSLLPLSEGQTLKVLVVDDDPKAVELIAVHTQGLASTVLRAYGGREAIEAARRELPAVIVLDLMMPEVSGFDVVEALKERPETARIPILVVTAKQITAADRATLSRDVAMIMEKTEFDPACFTAEVRRAMSGRPVVG